jgi:protein-S-isoprenylcysteine O-methyltransferase
MNCYVYFLDMVVDDSRPLYFICFIFVTGSKVFRFLPLSAGFSAVSFMSSVLFSLSVKPLDRWSFFVSSFILFHWGEFIFVAACHRESLQYGSFLFDNSWMYSLCMILSALEHLIIRSNSCPVVSFLGFAVAFSGLGLRWAAFIAAKTNFTHNIAESKTRDHKLVVSGAYLYCRHPGYAGWFWWCIGSQLALINTVCCCLFFFLSWYFFKNRISYEESLLDSFFGESFRLYKSKTPVMIPGIR